MEKGSGDERTVLGLDRENLDSWAGMDKVRSRTFGKRRGAARGRGSIQNAR